MSYVAAKARSFPLIVITLDYGSLKGLKSAVVLLHYLNIAKHTLSAHWVSSDRFLKQSK